MEQVILNNNDQQLEQLMLAIKERDESAFAQFYDSTVGRVYGLVSQILRNDHDAEEVVCDVYTQIWQASSYYDSKKGSVMAWVIVLSRSRTLDFLRKLKRRQSNEEHINTYLQLEQAKTATSEKIVSAFQESTHVHKVISELPLIQQQVLAFSFFQGLSHGEISELLELPLGTVKSHIRRALAKLRDKSAHLGEHYGH